jgi:hypothetical protein
MNEIDYSQFASQSSEPENGTELGFISDRGHAHDHDHCHPVPEASMLFPMVSFLLVVLLTRWLRDRHNRKIGRIRRAIIK